MGSCGPIYDPVPEIKEINMVWEDHNISLLVLLFLRDWQKNMTLVFQVT